VTVALLEVRSLTKRFGGLTALRGVDLLVEAGAAVGLVGPNGAGKTTLFDCVSGVTRADSGHLWFDGRRIDRMPVDNRARLGIGRTFQRLELFGGLTAREHLVVAGRAHRGDGRLWKDLLGRGQPSSAELDRADDLLGELGLWDIADAPIESLSLGQGRLVELGRALIGEPRLLLLDEPSSGLDSSETGALGQLLRTAHEARSVAVLLVEHDLELVASVAEQVVVLDFGAVIASGTMREVMADTAVRTAYLGEGQ
jgi:branched-chain amino acid transport system ATP-binding protein